MKVLKLLILHLLLVCSLSAASLWTIVVADTNDEELGDALEVDIMAIRRHVRNVARYAKLDLKLRLISGEGVTADAFFEIFQIAPEPDDVILFYWTGHGYRTLSKDKENNPWPNLRLGEEEVGLDHLEITEILASKGARLLISISDCCNNYINEAWAPETLSLTPKMWVSQAVEKSVSTQYAMLYRKARGVIIATSAEKGEYSFCNDTYGGFFTHLLLQNFNDEVKRAAPTSWNKIFEKTSADMKKLKETQHPHYELYLD